MEETAKVVELAKEAERETGVPADVIIHNWRLESDWQDISVKDVLRTILEKTLFVTFIGALVVLIVQLIVLLVHSVKEFTNGLDDEPTLDDTI